MLHSIVAKSGALIAAALPMCAVAQPCSSGWEVMTDGPNSHGRAMSTYQEGPVAALFVGGWFSSAGGVAARRIARWDGSTWSAVGDFIYQSGLVFSLLSFDDGTGSALYVGSSLQSAPMSSGILRWNGAQWSRPGEGLSGIIGCMAVHENQLYAGGIFWIPPYGEQGPRNLARWTGQEWDPVGGGVTHSGAGHGAVESLLSFDDGTGASLYVTGQFDGPIPYLMRIDQWGWHDTRGSWEKIWGKFATFDDGTGPKLYLGGRAEAAGITTFGVFRLDGGEWTLIGALEGLTTLAMWDDGSGPALYVGGGFTTINGTPMPHIARWDGTSWSGTGAEVLAGAIVHDFAAFDDGSGEALYVAGHFNYPGATRYLARYRPSCPCYANCDGSTVQPILNVDDFTCFINAFAQGSTLPPAQQVSHYSNCDASTVAPVLNVDDFTCFINAFAGGCP